MPVYNESGKTFGFVPDSPTEQLSKTFMVHFAVQGDISSVR